MKVTTFLFCHSCCVLISFYVVEWFSYKVLVWTCKLFKWLINSAWTYTCLRLNIGIGKRWSNIYKFSSSRQGSCWDKLQTFLKPQSRNITDNSALSTYRPKHKVTTIPISTQVMVLSRGHEKTYHKAPKYGSGWHVERQNYKITKISILTKVMVFTWTCKNISQSI
jgi:hypothetical protein